MWVAVAFAGLVLGAAVLMHRENVSSEPRPPAVSEMGERLAAIRGAWGSADEHIHSGCPSVDALERLLPELRGVHATERDYAGLTLGQKC